LGPPEVMAPTFFTASLKVNSPPTPNKSIATVARNRYSWLDPLPLSSILVHGDPDS
jgi:hypothetical protein